MKITVFEAESVCGEDLNLEALREFGTVSFEPTPDPSLVAERIGDSEVLICSKVRVTEEILSACPNLRYVGLTATGYNNVDLEACRRHGVIVTNIPCYSTDAVCQMTVAFLLQFATNLIRYEASTRRGDWTRSPIFCYYPYAMTELAGKTLGLFGLGSIGQRVAEVASALGMKVIYHCRTPKDLPYEFVSRKELFCRSDFLSLHCPLSAETENLICRETLSLMKPEAFLINTARGGLIREEDLAEALEAGRIAGFAADVLKTEPQREDCPLIGVKNCILTPHVAWAPYETRVRLIGILLDNLASWQKGILKNVVNP